MGRILVAGSINMDVTVQVDRRPKPGETVLGDDVEFVLGGKGANQAIAAGRTGPDVLLIGRVGEDRFGDELIERLDAEPVSLSRVRRDGTTASGMASITVDATSENSIVVVPGANDRVSEADVRDVRIERSDVAVSQFEIPQSTIRAFFDRAREAGATTVLNPAPAAEFTEPMLPLVDVLVVNETEAQCFSEGEDPVSSPDEVTLVETCGSLRAHDEQTIVVTRGGEGVLASTPTETITLDAESVDPVDTTGAGDAFVGALATALEEDRDLASALSFANAAGAAATTTRGAAPSLPTRAEVQALLDAG